MPGLKPMCFRGVSRTVGNNLLAALLLLAVMTGAVLSLSAQDSRGAQPQIPGGGFRIAGKVVNALGGTPLARVRVTITDAQSQQNTLSAITTEDGRFQFLQIPAGKYGLDGAKHGFIPASYQQHGEYSTAVVTGAGFDTQNLVLTLAPFAVLSGKVLDESGEPIRHANVSLYREDHRTGVGRVQKIRNDITDDLGAYEFSGLNAGTYFVSASATPWYAVHRPASESLAEGSQIAPSLDVAYPVSYYKDATEPDEALPIPIRGGDRLEADIHVNPVPAIRLLFRVSGNSENGFSLPQLQKPAFDGVDFVPNQGTEMISPGLYAMTGIAPGAYNVRIPTQGNSVDLDMDLSQDGQELDVSKGQPLGTITASVKVVGEETLPAQLSVALRNSKLRVVAWQQVDSKGNVEFDDVAPGKYEVIAEAPGKAYAPAHITLQDTELPGHVLTVEGGASLNVALSVVGSTMNVDGFAKRNGKPVSGAMIVLVPKNPESNRALFRRDQTDMDGSFSLLSVIPGTYTIVAIEDGWDMDWASPGVIASYSRHGKTITVSGNQGTMHLPDTVEVQAK